MIFKGKPLFSIVMRVFAATLMWLLATNCVAAAQTKAFVSDAAMLQYLEQTYFSKEYVPSAATAMDKIADLEAQLTVAQQQGWPQAQSRAALALSYYYLTTEQISKHEQLQLQYFHRYSLDTVVMLLPIELMQAQLQGDRPTVDALIKRSNKYREELNLYQMAQIDFSIGVALVQLRASIEAMSYLESALNVYTAVGDEEAISSVQNILAMVYSDQGNHQHALSIYTELLAQAEAVDSQFEAAIIYYNIGKTHLSAKQYYQAELMLIASLRLSAEIGDELGVAYAQLSLGKTLLQQQKYQQALEMTQQALAQFNPKQMLPAYLNGLVTLAEAQLMQGQYDEAKQSHNRARLLAVGANSDWVEQQLLKLGAELAKSDGNFQLAIELYQAYAQGYRDSLKKLYQSNSEQLLLELQRRRAEHAQTLLNQQQILQDKEISEFKKHQFALTVLITLMLVGCIGAGMFWKREVENSKALEQSSLRDHLTQAPNRRAIMQQLERTIDRAHTTGLPLCVALIDLDFFKRVNDLLGHDSGDMVLQEFAKTCDRFLRNGDSFGRIGGEEWLVIMPNTELSMTHTIFERLQKPWTSQHLFAEQSLLPLTFSMGAVQLQSNMKGEQLLKAADLALYQAKEQGRNRLVTVSYPLAEAV